MSNEIDYERIIEIPRYSMYGKALQGSNRSPRLAWCIYKANPRISVFLNNGLEGASGIIPAPMNANIMTDMLNHLEYIADGKETNYVNKCYTSTYDEQGNSSVSQEKKLLSIITLGKTEQGIVYIGVEAEGKPKLRFDFTMSDYHEVLANGQPLTESEASAAMARAAAMNLKKIYPILIARTPTSALKAQTPATAATAKSGSSFGDDFSNDITF